MTPRSRVLAAALALLLPAPLVRAEPPAVRVELDRLRVALEQALTESGHAPVLAGPRSSRAYHLRGYGGVIVLTPRVVPSARRVVVRSVERGPSAPGRARAEDVREMVAANLAELEREMEAQMAAYGVALRDMQAMHQDWSRERERQMRRQLRMVQEQVEAFRAAAERARRQVELEVRTRLVPPGVPAAVEGPAPVAPPAPAAPEAPPAPMAPPAPSAPEVEVEVTLPAPPDLPLPPPWRFWFDVPGEPEVEGMSAPNAEGVLAALREGVASALGGYTGPLTALPPTEVVTVAVDILPARPLRRATTRTLMVRVKARDLQERRAGRITPAVLRARLEFDEQ